MVVFGFLVERNNEALVYLRLLKKKFGELETDANIGVEFKHQVIRIFDNKKNFFVVVNRDYFHWLGFVAVGLCFILGGLFELGFLIWLSLVCSVLVALIHTPYFNYWIMLAGLRKSGYSGKVRLLSHAGALRTVALWGRI